MWSREQLKERAKEALKANYWKIILVTLIASLLGGTSGNLKLNYSLDESDSDIFHVWEDIFEDDEPIMEFDDVILGWDENGALSDEEREYYEEYYNEYKDGNLTAVVKGLLQYSRMGIVAFVIGIALVVIVFGVLISAFVCAPIEVGTKRFFVKSLNETAEVREVLYAFDHSYLNIVKILFIRNLCLFGWSLLCVIPGIIKAYEYQMIPYLLAENPNLSKEQVFALSKQMMSGNKWATFVLECTFIGWDILAGFTLGILNLFYVQPYKCLTYAALYEELSLINGRPASAGQAGSYTENYEYGSTNTWNDI